jgi:hypothetical protein
VTVRTVEGMAPHPGQARCLTLLPGALFLHGSVPATSGPPGGASRGSPWLTVDPHAKPRPESRGLRVEITDRVAIARAAPRCRTPPRRDGGSGK